MSNLVDYNPLKSIAIPNVGRVQPLDLVVVIGPNSSGKTQMLKDIQGRLLGGAIQKSEMSIYLIILSIYLHNVGLIVKYQYVILIVKWHECPLLAFTMNSTTYSLAS